MRKKSFFLASLFLFTLAVVFSYDTQWEFDEATTFFSTEHQRLIDIITYRTFNLANNHVINSIWVWLLQQLDTTTPFFYRLLSVCSYPLYLLYIYKLLRLETEKTKTNFFFIPLLLLPYFFFFGVARGYAMALAFFTISLYYYRKATTRGDTSLDKSYVRYLFYFTGAGIISSLSVFSFIYPIIAMHILHLTVVYLPLVWQKHFNLRRFLPFSISLLALLIIGVYIFKTGKIITQNDPMIIGSNSLLKGGTLSSLVTFLSLEHYVTHNYLVIIKIFILITLIPALISLIANRFYYHELAIFTITILLLIASHYIVGSLYPLTRSVAYLILLLYLPLTYYAMNYRGILIKAHLLLILLVGLLHLGILFNELRYKNAKDIAAYMAQTNDTLLTNVPNPNVLLYSHLHYSDALHTICISNPVAFSEKLKTSSYVVAYYPLSLDNDPRFELKYKMHLGNFYIRKDSEPGNDH